MAASPQPVLSDAAGVEAAYKRLLQIRKTEMLQGRGFSSTRVLLTLSHKYGHSIEDAEAAVKKFKTDIGRLKGDKLEADKRHSDFGVAPVMSTVLARLAEVKTATRLMARSTPVTRTAERGHKEIVSLARKMGFAVKTTENRAFYTTELRCDEGDFSLYVMGWHGTGMFAGGEKAILEFYDSREGEKPVLSIGVLNDDNITPPNEQKLIDHILTYIKTCR